MSPNVKDETLFSKPPPSPIHIMMTDDNHLGLINLREAGSLESHNSEEQEDLQKEIKLLGIATKLDGEKDKKTKSKTTSKKELMQKVA